MTVLTIFQADDAGAPALSEATTGPVLLARGLTRSEARNGPGLLARGLTRSEARNGPGLLARGLTRSEARNGPGLLARGPARRERATSTPADIAAELGRIGVGFERWHAGAELAPGASQDEVLAAYRADVDRLLALGGYRSADVVRMHPDHPDRAAFRTKFLAEHTHAEDEVRFFVEGTGAFYVRDGARVLKIVAERGDLLRLPAGTRHWFDMGPDPYFAAIRLFTSPDGWAAQFTGDTIAERVPLYLP